MLALLPALSSHTPPVANEARALLLAEAGQSYGKQCDACLACAQAHCSGHDGLRSDQYHCAVGVCSQNASAYCYAWPIGFGCTDGDCITTGGELAISSTFSHCYGKKDDSWENNLPTGPACGEAGPITSDTECDRADVAGFRPPRSQGA